MVVQILMENSIRKSKDCGSDIAKSIEAKFFLEVRPK
jgi:hypothetical protein